jgi:long-chain fatty acid transport protein
MSMCGVKQRAVLFLLTVSAGLSAQAAGFGLYEASARGNAMGGALVGDTGDASANYFNPANMTDLKGTHTMFGVTAVHPVLDLTSNGEKNNLDSGWFSPPHAYVTHSLSDDWFVGFGLYTEYGLGTKYDSDWDLKWSSTETTLETLTLNPNVAYKVTDRLSVAAGLRVMYLDFENLKTPFDNDPLSPTVPVTGSMRTRVQGDSWGYGYNLALSYKITDTLDAGFVYRSRVRQTVKGDFEVDSSASLGGSPLPPTHPAYPLPYGESSARGAIELPPSWTAGLNYRPVEKLNLGLTAIYTEWSTYEELTMTFGQTQGAPFPRSSETKDWKDVWRFGFGAEYLLTERWSIQGGYVYDMDPINQEHTDTMLPPGDRHIFSAGVGYAVDTWTVNASYGLIMMHGCERTVSNGLKSSETDFDDGFCHLIALSVGKHF